MGVRSADPQSDRDVFIMNGFAWSGSDHTAAKVMRLSPVVAAIFLIASLASARAAEQKLHDMLPEAIRQAGEIHVAANAAYPPFNFKNEAGESTGLEVALLNAVGEKVGIKMRYTPIDFLSVLPGVLAGRFDVGAAGFNNTDERRQVADFVNYAYTVDGFVVPKGNPGHVSVTDACGKKISVSQGTYQMTNLQALSEKCVAGGKAPIDIMLFQGMPPQAVALRSGRVEGADVDKAVGNYLVKQNSRDFEGAPGAIANVAGLKLKMGFILKKNENIDLAKALVAGMNAIVADGTYAKILKEWEIPPEATLPESTLN